MSRLMDIHRFRRHRRAVSRHVRQVSYLKNIAVVCKVSHGNLPKATGPFHALVAPESHMGIYYTVTVTDTSGRVATFYVMPTTTSRSFSAGVSYAAESCGGMVYDINHRHFIGVEVNPDPAGKPTVTFLFRDLKREERDLYTFRVAF